MHNRVMRSAVTALLALMVPAAALASSARVEGMNVPGDYLKDYTGIYTYLSGINNVGNLVYADAGDWNGSFERQVGAVLPNLWDGKMGVWAIHLREAQPALGQATDEGSLNPSNIGLGSDPNFAGEAFDIMWGHKLGGGTLGLRLNRSFFSFDNGTTTAEGGGNTNRNVLGIGAGVGFDLNPNASIEVSGLFQNRSFDNGTGFADDGGTAYQFAARGMWKMGSNAVLIPVIKVFNFDLSTTNGGVSSENKINGWQFGAAGNWEVGSGDLLVLGAQFAGNHQKTSAGGGPTSEVNETYYPNLFLSFETHVNSWLTLRAGAQNAAFYSVKNEPAGGPTTTEKDMVFSFLMGAGVKLSNVQLDATLDSAFPHNPFAQLWGGNSAVFEDGEVPFPHVTATYTW